MIKKIAKASFHRIDDHSQSKVEFSIFFNSISFVPFSVREEILQRRQKIRLFFVVVLSSKILLCQRRKCVRLKGQLKLSSPKKSIDC